MAITQIQALPTSDGAAATALYCALATRYPSIVPLPTLERGDKDAIEAQATGISTTATQLAGAFTKQLYLHVRQEMVGVAIATTLSAAQSYSGDDAPRYSIASCTADFAPPLDEDEAGHLREEMPAPLLGDVLTVCSPQTRPLRPSPPMIL